MTTTVTTDRTSAIANGTTPIPFTFQAISASEIGVLRNDVEQVGGFTVALNGDGTGSVTPLTSWGTDAVVIYSKPSYQQPSNFDRFAPLYPDQLNPPLDRQARVSISLAQRLAAIEGEIAASFKGDPGGNIMAIGLFAAAAGLSIPSGTDAVRTAGHSVNGVGIADYVADAAVDTAYVAANPRTSFISANGRGFRLAPHLIVTPYMVGARGANVVSNPAAVITDQATLDASTDDSDALQAFFDHAFSVSNSHFVYDWEGHWAISKPIYFGRPLVNTGTLNVEYHGRNFINGKLHVLPVAQQPGGVAMDTVLTLASPFSNWAGHLLIHAGDRGTAAYADRRFKYGVKIFQTQESEIGQITVISAKKDAVKVDATFENWTLRAGTPYEVSSTSKNNIGLQISSAVGINCGSCALTGDVADARLHSQTITARVQGGDPTLGGTTFDPTTATYPGSANQQTKLTVASTAEMAVGDWGKMRVELAPANYTSIAADSGTKKFTFTSGSPAALGLGVGQKFTLVDGNNVGANDGIWYEITAVGASDITVYPAPTTETAKVYTALNTEFSPHRVMRIVSGTEFTVYPWVPDTANSKWFHISGAAARVVGADAANVRFGYLGANNCGMCLASEAQYGPLVENLLCDFVEVGVAFGINAATVHAGTTILHTHSEAVTWDIIQVAQSAGHMRYGAGSAFSKTAMALLPRNATTSARQSSYDLLNVDFNLEGVAYGPTEGVSYLTDATVSNLPQQARRTMLADWTVADNHTVTLSFDEQAARFGKRTADVLWVAADGTPPTGTLTFALDATMTGKGWTLGGTTTMTAPGTPVRFLVIFDRDRKKVLVTKSAFAKSTGWTADTGTAEKTAHATYTGGTAGATYTQAEITAIRNSLQDVSRGQKAIKDALLALNILGA